jgi:hypothetical protein
MLTCDYSTIVWPSWRVYALAAAAQVPCVVLLHLLGLALYVLFRDRRLAFFLWPAAVAIALMPFWLLPHAVSLLPAEYAADAQLGRFFAATASSFAAFRTIEAALGTTPVGGALSLQGWLLYFTSAIDPRYADGKMVKAAPGAALARLARVPVRMVALGGLISILRPYDHTSALAGWLAVVGLGPTAVRCTTNVVTSPAIWLFLALCFDLGAVPLLLQGVDATEAFLNPVFASRAIKEFWGKRWNLQVQTAQDSDGCADGRARGWHARSTHPHLYFTRLALRKLIALRRLTRCSAARASSHSAAIWARPALPLARLQSPRSSMNTSSQLPLARGTRAGRPAGFSPRWPRFAPRRPCARARRRSTVSRPRRRTRCAWRQTCW